jgi:hypothetical protein
MLLPKPAAELLAFSGLLWPAPGLQTGAVQGIQGHLHVQLVTVMSPYAARARLARCRQVLSCQLLPAHCQLLPAHCQLLPAHCQPVCSTRACMQHSTLPGMNQTGGMQGTRYWPAACMPDGLCAADSQQPSQVGACHKGAVCKMCAQHKFLFRSNGLLEASSADCMAALLRCDCSQTNVPENCPICAAWADAMRVLWQPAASCGHWPVSRWHSHVPAKVPLTCLSCACQAAPPHQLCLRQRELCTQ